MINRLIDNIKNMEKPIIKVMLQGFRFSFLICLLSLMILELHITYPFSHIVYDAGLILFRTGIMIAVSFFMCAFATDKLKNSNI